MATTTGVKSPRTRGRLPRHEESADGAADFPPLEERVQTHIFLCVLAYHVLVAIEQRCLDQGVHTSWATRHAQLSTHHVVTMVLPATNGQTLRIRKGSTPEAIHREIYRMLEIPHEIMTPVRTWAPTPSP
jgi:hypothetical protein